MYLYIRLVTDSSGHFVLLKIIDTFSYAETKFIDDWVAANAMRAATNQFGLRVIKQLFSNRRGAELTNISTHFAQSNRPIYIISLFLCYFVFLDFFRFICVYVMKNRCSQDRGGSVW